MPDSLENTNPNRYTCKVCKRKWIASDPNRNRKGDAVCTLCLTNKEEK